MSAFINTMFFFNSLYLFIISDLKLFVINSTSSTKAFVFRYILFFLSVSQVIPILALLILVENCIVYKNIAEVLEFVLFSFFQKIVGSQWTLNLPGLKLKNMWCKAKSSLHGVFCLFFIFVYSCFQLLFFKVQHSGWQGGDALCLQSFLAHQRVGQNLCSVCGPASGTYHGNCQLLQQSQVLPFYNSSQLDFKFLFHKMWFFQPLFIRCKRISSI